MDDHLIGRYRSHGHLIVKGAHYPILYKDALKPTLFSTHKDIVEAVRPLEEE